MIINETDQITEMIFGRKRTTTEKAERLIVDPHEHADMIINKRLFSIPNRCDNFHEYIYDTVPKISNKYDIIIDSALRRYFINNGMFAAVTWSWTKPLAEFLKGKKVLEVMAGRGWLTLALRHLGVDIVGVDDFSWYKDYSKWKHHVTEIEKMDAVEAVDRHNDTDYIIMSWPPYNEKTAYRVLEKMHKVNPNTLLIFIGESYGGCTADDEFFEHYKEIKDLLPEEVNSKYERLFGMGDHIMIGKYTKNAFEY